MPPNRLKIFNGRNGKSITATADGKSKSGGHVPHSDISDAAVDTHKEKNGAEYVAIIEPDFSGDTTRNHARKKPFALMKTAELCEIARTSRDLGLSLDEIALRLKMPDGLSELNGEHGAATPCGHWHRPLKKELQTSTKDNQHT